MLPLILIIIRHSENEQLAIDIFYCLTPIIEREKVNWIMKVALLNCMRLFGGSTRDRGRSRLCDSSVVYIR